MFLDKFGISNFKCFSEPIQIAQRPITINIGPNNSGKSSVVNAINLVKHSLELQHRSQSTILESIDSLSLKNFGSPKTYLNDPETELSITLKVHFEETPKWLLNKSVSITLFYTYCNNYKCSIKSKIPKASGSIISLVKEADGLGTISKYVININNIPTILISRGKFDKKSKFLDYKNWGEMQVYDYRKGNETSNPLLSEYHTKLEFDFYTFTDPKQLNACIEQAFKETPIKNDTQWSQLIKESLNSIIEFQEHISKVKTIDLNRREYKRHFDNETQGPFKDFIHQYYSRGENNIEKTKELLKLILPLFNLPNKLKITEPVDYGFQIFLEMPDGSERNIVDFGSGINQLLPLLLLSSGKIKSVNEYNSETKSHEPRYLNSLIIVEEPESNLHPNFQSKLADMFTILHKERNLNFMIETHSEYMVRKFQNLIASGELNHKAIIINYFWESKGIHKCKQIEFKEDGGLTDTFENGFFDESFMLEMDLLKTKNLN